MAFVVVLILSNISAANVVYINDVISLSAAEILFPISYIINDLLVEFYGKKTVNRIVFTGLFLALFSTVFLYVTTLLPSNYVEYNTVFGYLTSGVIGITIASFIAYGVGSFSNVFIMSRFKKRDKEKGFFKRAILSSFVAEFLDSLVFITLCCIFAPEFYLFSKLISLVLTIFVIKICVEIIVFPVTNAIRKMAYKKNLVDKY